MTTRRTFLKTASLGAGAMLTLSCLQCARKTRQPNIVFVFADQWRAQDTGYAGNAEVRTPNLDKLSQESMNFTTAVSGCPVCSPYRASLLTGQYWLTHGIFHNDKPLRNKAVTLAKACKQAGYDTGYIGKWHLNGDDEPGYVTGRTSPVPKERRQGFDFWNVHECTHNYNHSVYYDENNEKHVWDGYDAIAQTRMANQYIKDHADGKPFLLVLSWGPPHAPYQTAPQSYRDLYDEKTVTLRPNVPADVQDRARKAIAGYYAHITALDDCMNEIMTTLHVSGIDQDTILVFTSDHGDMLFSHDMIKKQKPWDESIRVPFLLRYPRLHGTQAVIIDSPINTPDIMPTLLGLCGIPIPETVEGQNFAKQLESKQDIDNKAALIMLPVPFHQWNYHRGGKEYRGLRTRRYTYTRDLNGPWLLYDNERDPYQMNNVVLSKEYAVVQSELDDLLNQKLTETDDSFLPGPAYMRAWNYDWDKNDAPDQQTG